LRDRINRSLGISREEAVRIEDPEVQALAGPLRGEAKAQEAGAKKEK